MMLNLIMDLEIDAQNFMLHVLTNNDYFHAISLIDTSFGTPLPDNISSTVFGPSSGNGAI